MISLTSGEFAVLKTLCQRPRQPMSREKLLMLARGRDIEAYDRSIDVQISRLRRLIEKMHRQNHVIFKRFGALAMFLSPMKGEPRMRLVPKSLLGRMLLTIITVLMISQLLTNVLFRQIYLHRQSDQRMALLGENLRSIHNALLALPPAQRGQFLRRIAQHHRFFFHAESQGRLPFPAMAPQRDIMQMITTYVSVSATSPRKLDVRIQRNGIPTVWIKLHARQQSFWLGVPYKHFSRPMPLVWVMWLLIAAIFAILGSVWLVALINKPLQKLALAAEDIGRGKQPEKLKEEGPLEICQLSHAFNKMADDINILTSNRLLLLAGVSHDLRTPLARLRLTIEMLSTKNFEQYKNDMVIDIEDLDNIIEQFLMFVRHGSGEPLTKGNLNALLHSLAKRYHKQGIDITLNLAELPEFEFKPISLQRLLINLISNAYKYAGNDIEIMTRFDEKFIKINVLDRGPGIAEEDIARLLEPFTQLATQEDSSGGTGLGLAIVKRIVAVHQGKLALLAREGGGLNVEIYLPRTLM